MGLVQDLQTLPHCPQPLSEDVYGYNVCVHLFKNNKSIWLYSKSTNIPASLVGIFDSQMANGLAMSAFLFGGRY